MARPQKVGLDYFPLDVDFLQDVKVRKIMRACGNQAISILISLLSSIYRNDGYYVQWDNDMPFLVADEVGASEGAVLEVVNKAIQVGFFDEDIFKRYKVLTSRGIQKRYLEAVSRRKKINLIKEYLLIDLENEYNNLINEYNNSINVDINSINDDISTQRKEKKSKEKKSKEKEDISLQIKNLRSRYSEEQLKVIDEYFDILRWTRKNGKIADSVVLKIYQEWEKYPVPKVIYALKVYINNPRYHDKRENYCYGIMRNATAEEIAKGGINNGQSKGNNGRDDDQYAGIGFTAEDLQELWGG